MSAQVGIVMGSDSDWPTMQAAAEVLDELGVTWEADVRSAHRMPQEMLEYGATAAQRGLSVIIAGAGGAAARSEEHTSELQSLMRISYAVFCLKKKNTPKNTS